MGKLTFVDEKNITKSFIFNHFRKLNLTTSEWYGLFKWDDFELNIEGKIERREYYARCIRTWKGPYRKILLFRTFDHLHKALLAVGFDAKKANDVVGHETRHAEKMKNQGYIPCFGLFIDANSPTIKGEGVGIKYMALTFRLDGNEVALRKKLSVEEEIEEDMDTANIEGRGEEDIEKIANLKKLKDRVKEIKEQRGFLPQWRF